MAGAGVKLFVDGEDFDANEANTYLMDQSIMRFATTAARDAAFGGVGEPALAEGMTCYIDADNSIYSYNGGSWVKLVSSSSPAGLELLRVVSIPSSPTSSIDVTSVFSATYDDYKVLIEADGNGTAVFWDIRLLIGSTPTAGSGYYINGTTMTSNSTAVQGNALANYSSFQLGAQQGGTDRVYHEFEIRGAFKTELTQLVGRSTTYLSGFGYNYTYTEMHNLATSYDGFRVSVATGSFNTGTIRIYGYRNAI